jgi:serine/threonine-protein kinase
LSSARATTARAETLFRQHLAALPEGHADRTGHIAYLQGDGALTLVTDPPGAEVRLHRYVLHNRRLVARFERSLGTTPVRSVSLPMGSYLCVLKHPDRAEVRYPVAIGRGEHWHGVPPEGGDPTPIPLPRPGELGPDDRYVPPGWFACGGDPHQENSLSARRIWVDGHVFRRFPVTNTGYMAFLDALVAEGRTEEALRHAPRERGGMAGEQGALIYGFDGTRFSLRPDADGDVWEPDWPVCMVDWHGARAFAAWEAIRTGQPWRLPGELAWEKAARGVDGRFYPWGDAFDPSWASMRRSHRGRMLPTAVGAFPVDESPYGIRDMAGSMRDWCNDAFVEAGPPAASARHASATVAADPPAGAAPGDVADAAGQASARVYRGGSWGNLPRHARVAFRFGSPPFIRLNYLGLRLVRTSP